MIPTAQTGAYSIAYSSTDWRGVPNPKANPGTLPEHVIVLSQLTAQRQEFEASIGDVSNALSAEIAARIAAITAMEADLVARINELALEGVRQKVTVGARVTALPTNLNNIPGFTPGSVDVDGRLFVDSAAGDSGIYIAVGGTLTRDPAFITAEDFESGLMVWVDSDNTFWLLKDAGTGTGNSITTDFEPFGRMQDLMAAAGSAIAFDGNRVTWRYDPTYLNVANGQATLSEAFKSRINTVETSAQTASENITALQATDATQSTAIAALTTDNNLQGLAIASNTADIASISARTTSVETSVATKASTTDVTALSARTTSVESDLLNKAASSDVASLSARTTSVEDVASTNTSSITTLSARTTNVETSLLTKASSNDVTLLGDRVATTESDLTSKANTTDVSALSARTTSVETSVATKASSSDVTALTDRVATNESAITTKANAADVTALSARTTSVEEELGTKVSLADLLTVCVSKALSGGVATKVGNNTHTTFTVAFPVAGYTWFSFTLTAAPKSLIKSELVTHPGNSCVMTFVTGLGVNGEMQPIDDNAVTANFLKTVPFEVAFPNF